MITTLTPVVTEKALIDQERGHYHFFVDKSATKTQIFSIFKSIYSQNPVKISTHIVKGKVKQDFRRRQQIIKSDRKKVIITLAKGQRIEALTLNKK